MKYLRKIVLLILILTAGAFTVAAFAGCKKTDEKMESVSISENSEYPYDGSSTVYASEMEVHFVKEADCADDAINESKLFSEGFFVGETPYLMVIDFSFGVKADNDGTIVLDLSISDSNVGDIEYRVIDVATSDIEENADNGETALRFGFKVPEKSGSGRKFRIVVRFTPGKKVDDILKIDLSVKNGTVSGKTSIKSGVLVTPYGLKLGLSFDGSHYIVKGYMDDSFERVDVPSTFKNRPIGEIGDNAFKEFKKLKYLSIPDSLVNIGRDAFEGCTNLQYNEYDNAYYLGDEANEYFALVEVKDPAVNSCDINDGTQIIAGCAFSECETLTSVTIPDGITGIGGSAFDNCGKLTTVHWNASDCVNADSVRSPIFKNCANLATVIFGNSVKSIPAYAFSSCSALTSVNIPDSVTDIGERAFSGCSGLTSVTIPDGVTNIGYEAFCNCSGLTSVTVPDSVTSIGSSAFEKCIGLNSVTIGNGVTRIRSYSFSGCDSLTRITIPNGVNYIDDNAFRGCGALTSITIPDNVRIIGNDAFLHCKSLTNVTIGNGVTSIGKSAFMYCSALTSVIIPDGVTSIGSSAFDNCSGLTSVTIGKGVSSIGDSAFSHTSLTSITVDENNKNYKSIDGNLFTKDGSTLIQYAVKKTDTSFVIPDGVEEISDLAFFDCSSLTSITIPEGVEKIGDYAFYNCSGLTTVDYNGTKDSWNKIVIGKDNDNLTNAEIKYND